MHNQKQQNLASDDIQGVIAKNLQGQGGLIFIPIDAEKCAEFENGRNYLGRLNAEVLQTKMYKNGILENWFFKNNF